MYITTFQIVQEIAGYTVLTTRLNFYTACVPTRLKQFLTQLSSDIEVRRLWRDMSCVWGGYFSSYLSLIQGCRAKRLRLLDFLGTGANILEQYWRGKSRFYTSFQTIYVTEMQPMKNEKGNYNS